MRSRMEHRRRPWGHWRALTLALAIVAAHGRAWPTPAAGQEVVSEEQSGGGSDATAAIHGGQITGGQILGGQEPESPWSATAVPVEDLAPMDSVAPTLKLKQQGERPKPPIQPARKAAVRPGPAMAAPVKVAPPLRQSTHAKEWAPVVVPTEVTHSLGGKPEGSGRLPQEGKPVPQEGKPAAAPDFATAAAQGTNPTPPPGQGGRTPVPGAAPAPPVPAPDPVKKAEPVTAAEKPAQQYCINISSAAADARFAWEKKSMEEVARDLDERIAKLEEKTEEYKKWLARRDEFASKAQQDLVAIYTKMKPDAAAAQMADMNEEMAAALLLKLKPTNASAILNEINPVKGARLAMILGLAARSQQTKQAKGGEATPAAGKTPAPQEEKKL